MEQMYKENVATRSEYRRTDEDGVRRRRRDAHGAQGGTEPGEQAAQRSGAGRQRYYAPRVGRFGAPPKPGDTTGTLALSSAPLRASRPDRRGTGPGGDVAPVFPPRKAAATSHVGAAAASARSHGNSPESALSSSIFPTLPHFTATPVFFARVGTAF
ncbi:hypothetical protein MRX96_018074 [Rhipicephalus microplus]